MGLKSIIRLALSSLWSMPKKELIGVIDVLRKKYLLLEKEKASLEKEVDRLKTELARRKESEEKQKIRVVNEQANKPSSKQAEWEEKGVGNDGNGKKKGRGKKRRKGSGSKPKKKMITKREKTKLDRCYKCGKDLSKKGELSSPTVRIIEDIPEVPVKLEVIEVEQQKKYCDNCQQVVTASTEFAVPRMNVGINTTITIVYLWIFACMSLSRISGYLNDFFNQSLSTSGISKHLIRISTILKPVYDQILEEVRQSEILHGDETGWRVNGINWWLWVVGNFQWAYYLIDKSRGKDVVRKILGQVFVGVLVVDGWRAYLSVICEQQSCMAHLLRKIRKLYVAFPRLKSVMRFYITFRKILRDGEKLQSQKEQLSEVVFDRKLQRLHQRLEGLLNWKNPNDILKSIIKKVRNQQPRILTFVKHPGVPCHNNYGEYLIRIGVLKRKVSFGSKSAKGAQAYAILLSIYTTCKLRKISFPHFLKISLKHYSKFRKPLLIKEYEQLMQNSSTKVAA